MDFWNWYGSQALAEWIGALGTAGALILGFIILLGDRQNRKQEQGNRVHLWQTIDNDGERYTLHNASDGPIFAITIHRRSLTTAEWAWQCIRQRTRIEEHPARTASYNFTRPGGHPLTPAGVEAIAEVPQIPTNPLFDVRYP